MDENQPNYPRGASPSRLSNFRRMIENLYDFLPDDSEGWKNSSSARASTADFKATGIWGGTQVKLNGVNTLDDYARVMRDNDEAVELGVGKYVFDSITYVHLKIPNTSHKSKFFLGIGDSKVGTALLDGIWFEYDENDTNWQCVTANAGTETKTDTGIAIASATKYDLKFKVNSDATSVKFFVNKLLKATHTTNIPTIFLSPILYGRCTATHTEAGEATLVVDAIYEKLRFTNSR